MLDEILATHGHVHDPHRRWLRRTYQEGPGFRFLATRGGRPPRRGASGRALAVLRERARWVRIMREDGLAAALSVGGCSRASLFRCQSAYERGGLRALLPEPRGPRHPRLRHPDWLEQVVTAVRLHTYWNAKRVAAELPRPGDAPLRHCSVRAPFHG